MPYEISSFSSSSAPDHSGADGIDTTPTNSHVLRLWPYRSLPRIGFVWFIGGTAALISLPLFTLLGSPVLWGMLPFLVLAIAAIWWALQRSYSDGEIVEHLAIGPDQMTLVRQGPRGKRAEWQANPYWVTPVLHSQGGPVPNYLTLRGGVREVELGAFLSEGERIALHGEVTKMLHNLK